MTASLLSGDSRQTVFTHAQLRELGFTRQQDYADGVIRWSQPVGHRLELVVFIEHDGFCPCGVQVWIDGLPQEELRLV